METSTLGLLSMSASQQAAGWPLHAGPHATIRTRAGSRSPSPVQLYVPASTRCSAHVCWHARTLAGMAFSSRAQSALLYARACAARLCRFCEKGSFFSKGCRTRRTHTTAGPHKTHDAVRAAPAAQARLCSCGPHVVSGVQSLRRSPSSSCQSHADTQNVREERAVEPSAAIVDACAAGAGVRASVSKSAHACALARARVQ